MIVDVPALKVSPTTELKETLFVMVIADDPSDIDLVVALVVANVVHDTAKLPVLKSPLLGVICAVLVNALPSVHPPPTPLNTTANEFNVTLLVVTVLPVVVARKFKVQPAVEANATPVAALSQLPCTLMIDVAADVMVTLPTAGPDMLTSRQVAGLAVRPIVTA